MRKIAIVGAGQGGLLLGFGLLEMGYDVTLVSDRDAESILHGSLPNTAAIYADGLAHEKALGLNFWDGLAPDCEGMSFDFRGPDGALALSVHGAFLDGPGQALDHRTKFHRWVNEFVRRGGRLHIANLRVEDLDALAAENDLTVVAGGKGPITRLFGRDIVRSRHYTPARRLVGAVFTGKRFSSERPWSQVPFCPVRAHVISGVGEYFSLPFYAHGRGMCRAILMEAIPGSPMDSGGTITDAEGLTRYIQDMVRRFSPDEGDLVDDIELVDPKAWLRGSFTPEVRKGTAKLPSGRTVLGLGDAVVLNDPAGGQGANNANKTAHLYTQCILAHGDQPFDSAWMTSVFEDSWNAASRYATRFTDAMLREPNSHLLSIIGNASGNPQVARAFASTFNRPDNLVNAIRSEQTANDFVQGAMHDAA